MFGHLSLDKPLSKHDFLYEIKHWFRRAIWFLGFTAAYTLSPTILFLTVGPPNLDNPAVSGTPMSAVAFVEFVNPV